MPSFIMTQDPKPSWLFQRALSVLSRPRESPALSVHTTHQPDHNEALRDSVSIKGGMEETAEG